MNKKATKINPNSYLTRARLKFEEGRYPECLRSCQYFYQNDPSDLGNLLLLSACHFQLNKIEESVFYGQQAISVDPTFVEALVVVGNGLKELGKLDDARACYDKALRIQPRFAHPYAASGCIHFGQNRFKEAIECFEMAASLDPSFKTNLGLTFIAFGDKVRGKNHLSHQSKSSAIARLGLGNLAHEEGEYDAASDHFTQALKLEPSFIDAATNLCGTYIESFKLIESASRLEKIIASFKHSVSAHFRLGLCHRHEGRYKQAHRNLWHAITLDPTNADALCNLAALHVETGEFEQAAKLCLRLLQSTVAIPRTAIAHAFCTLGLSLFHMGSCVHDALKCLYAAEKLISSSNICCSLGTVLNELGDRRAAAKILKKAIALEPFDIPAFLNMGNAYFEHGRLEYAEKCYQTSIDSKTKHNVVALNNLLLLHLSQGNFVKAASCGIEMRQILDINGEESATLCTLAIIEAYTCQWVNRSKTFERVVAGKSSGTVQPFHSEFIPQISPQMALSISNMFSGRFRQRALHNNNRSNVGSLYKHNISTPDSRVRIGYVSSCFGNTATTFLSNKIFELHIRTKFRVFCFDLAGSDGSSEWKAVRESADVFLDVSRSDHSVDVANEINEHCIDILVDLDGFVVGSMPEIFTLRPAPIQITMSCGTTGSESGIDYLVGDKFTIPEHHRSYFSEKIIYVPNIMTSYSRDLGLDVDRHKMRKRWGVSNNAFVYACFSQPYKMDPELFVVWMEILREVPNSSLVLLRYSLAMEKNLRREAAKHNIVGDQIVFWDLVPRHEHLERCCLVDTYLDTVVCSGIATGCDALWSGAPLITLAGDRICNRVGASLVSSAGLEEFIALNLVEYKELAVALSAENNRIDILHLLDDARENSPLFDSLQWVQSFESALDVALDRCRQDLEPEHIIIPTIDERK